MINFVRSENVPVPAVAGAGAVDAAAGLPEAAFFFGGFVRLRAKIAPY
jgi:16S rRNA C1402 (ribose-2'-O) methylase RsmI